MTSSTKALTRFWQRCNNKGLAVAAYHVLLTQPDNAESAFSQALIQQGFAVSHYPAFSIQALAFQLPTTLPQALIVTSPNAWQHFYTAEIANGLKRVTQLFAVGPGTAEAMQKSLKQTVLHPPKQAGSEALLALPAIKALRSAWLISGEGGRGLLDQALQQQGTQLTRINSYRRQPFNQPTQLAKLLKTLPHIIIATSRETLDNLWHIADADIQARLSACHWVVSSERVAERLREYAPQVSYTLSHGHGPQNILAACQRWRQTKRNGADNGHQ